MARLNYISWFAGEILQALFVITIALAIAAITYTGVTIYFYFQSLFDHESTRKQPDNISVGLQLKGLY